MEKTKKILKSKNVKIAMFVILDALILVISTFLALAIRFDFANIPEVYMNSAFKYVLLDIGVLFSIFVLFKLYFSSWIYASITELINIVLACFVYEIVEFSYKVLLSVQMPKSYFIIKFLLLIIFVAVLRYSYRIIRTIVISINNKKSKNNTMIIGAGSAGKLLITEIYNNPEEFNNRVVCVIDDDKDKIGTYINGIPIVGNREKIKEECEKRNIKEIIIAMPSVSTEKIGLIADECQKTDCEIRILPSLGTMVGKPSMKKLKKLSYEDFLGRNQIVVDVKEIASNIKDKVILVTGGGGSIGSELSRQIAKCNPKQLIIFDIYENNAYDIQQELRRTYPKLDLQVIIGSVRDYDRLENVFKTYKPHQVFHAAAHKHVPLMEDSPNEAIKNNCLGTLNTVKLADKYKVKKFVLISTDKAVRPTNVMGATKRICEMIIQTYNKKSKTDYVAVRFGNVLGSNGSVIPLFMRQIDEGGPVTVTHKEITRYFMTIPEAVSLVLQASVYALGGEIFVLDMGSPVKIYDLAKRIIKFRGYEPDVDIKIKITGLRPGEKLYEELLMDEEGLKETPNKLIHIGQPIKLDEEKFLNDLDKLIESAYQNKNDIKEKVAKIVTTYKVDRGDKV